jgi:hypothetical protein
LKGAGNTVILRKVTSSKKPVFHLKEEREGERTQRELKVNIDLVQQHLSAALLAASFDSGLLLQSIYSSEAVMASVVRPKRHL